MLMKVIYYVDNRIKYEKKIDFYMENYLVFSNLYIYIYKMKCI